LLGYWVEIGVVCRHRFPIKAIRKCHNEAIGQWYAPHRGLVSANVMPKRLVKICPYNYPYILEVLNCGSGSSFASHSHELVEDLAQVDGVRHARSTISKEGAFDYICAAFAPQIRYHRAGVQHSGYN
jgi:hypothetical protein